MLDKRTGNNLFHLFWLLIFIPVTAVAELRESPPVDVVHQSPARTPGAEIPLPELIAGSIERFSDIASANLDGLLARIGDARVVLLGESSHGTREFYEMRARITRELITSKGFNLIAVEGDWADVSRIDYFIRSADHDRGHDAGHIAGDRPMYTGKPFTEFPQWMWRNESVLEFTYWLKNHNRNADEAVGFYGIDIYNLFGSIDVVLDYLYSVDPAAANFARRQYACLSPWTEYPPDYGHYLKTGKARPCKKQVMAVLQTVKNKQEKYRPLGKERYFAALQNAKLVVNGERYFRTMEDGDAQSWNQRDSNMFERLQAILKHRGTNSKVVVWAHNVHIGDSRATDMHDHDEINLGRRVREAYGNDAYLVGFGMDHGTVAAASNWQRPVEFKRVQHAQKDSYEYLFHQVRADNFLLPLRRPAKDILLQKLLPERLERAIGSTYDPNDELNKHYYVACLPREFDEYIFFNKTHAVKPLRDVPAKP